MSLENFAKIEQGVGLLLAEIERLMSENQRLNERLSELQQQVETLTAFREANEQKLQKLARLESSQKKYESEREIVRVKVQTIMEDLEKLDIL